MALEAGARPDRAGTASHAQPARPGASSGCDLDAGRSAAGSPSEMPRDSQGQAIWLHLSADHRPKHRGAAAYLCMYYSPLRGSNTSPPNLELGPPPRLTGGPCLPFRAQKPLTFHIHTRAAAASTTSNYTLSSAVSEQGSWSLRSLAATDAVLCPGVGRGHAGRALSARWRAGGRVSVMKGCRAKLLAALPFREDAFAHLEPRRPLLWHPPPLAVGLRY